MTVCVLSVLPFAGTPEFHNLWHRNLAYSFPGFWCLILPRCFLNLNMFVPLHHVCLPFSLLCFPPPS